MGKKETPAQKRTRELREAFQAPGTVISAAPQPRTVLPPEPDDNELVVVEGLDPSPEERPIERETVEVVITQKAVHERCPHCARLVKFNVKVRRPDISKVYVSCPRCGRRSVKNQAADTIKPIAER